MRTYTVKASIIIILTIIFAHNPLSGYTTYTTKEYTRVEYLSKDGSGVNCREKREILFAIQMGEHGIIDRKETLNNRDTTHLSAEIIANEKKEMESLLKDEVELKKKKAIEQYAFDENCFKSEQLVSENTELPFSMWATKGPIIAYFGNLSMVIYMSLFIIVITFVITLIPLQQKSDTSNK